MLQTSSTAVAVVDRQGMVLLVNESLIRLLGFSSDDLLGRPSQLFLPGTPMCDHTEPPACSMSHCESGHVVERTVAARCKDGSELWVNVEWHRILGPRGSLLLAQLFPTDLPLLPTDQPLFPTGQNGPDHDRLDSERLAAIAQMANGLAHESRNTLQRAVACLDLQ